MDVLCKILDPYDTKKLNLFQSNRDHILFTPQNMVTLVGNLWNSKKESGNEIVQPNLYDGAFSQK